MMLQHVGVLRQTPDAAVFHDVFHNRIRFEGRLVTRTGLHIGSGSVRDVVATDHPVVRDALGRPYIPGSSLKGILRSAAESLLRSVPWPKGKGVKPKIWSCDVLGRSACVDDERRDALQKEWMPSPDKASADDHRTLVEAIWEESCTVCRLFGSTSLGSRVRFPDLLLASDAPPLEVRNGVGIDRDKEQAARGILYDFEAVPPGTEFQLVVLADNVKDFEVGLLLYLFDELHRGHLGLGGKTSRGLGQMEVQWTQIEETRLDPAAPQGGNPFAQLLVRQQLMDLEAESDAEPELPLPGGGDQDLWRRMADGLDRHQTVDEAVLGDLIQKENLGSKAELNNTLALGLVKTRQYRKVILQKLEQCGRLVSRDGELVPAVVAAEAEHDGAALDARLRPLYERFVHAMHDLWQEVC